MRKYQELRWHSEFSIGFGAGKVEEHAARAAELGMPALALTEAGTMRGAYSAHEIAKKKGVRVIQGVEFVMVEDHRRRALTAEEEAEIEDGPKAERRRAVNRAERRLGLDRSSTVTVRAATPEGVLNLFRLSSRGWIDGLRRGRPRIDLALLEAYAGGLVVSIGGADGLADPLAKSTAAGVALLAKMREMFPDRLFLELHPHTGNHKSGNRATVLLGEHLDIPRIAVNDVRYVFHDDVDAHTAALCLARRGMTFENPSHPRSVEGYHLRSGDEVFEAFRFSHPDIAAEEIESAIARTLDVGELCAGALHVDPHRALVPSVVDGDDFAALVRLCREGWTWRDIPGRAKRRLVDHADYARQLKHELETIRAAGKFAAYFLYVRDIIQWCRRNGVMVGPGRGSAAGALVCYLLGITSIDPLEHGLMFERFLAPGRLDTPDIDVDFDQSRRKEVIQYIRQKYGEEHVAMITTYGKMHGKGALKDVCRVLGLPFGTVNAVTASFPNAQGDEKIAVREVLQGSREGRNFLADYPQVLALVERLEGSIRQVGVHAAGVVASPVPISEVCPVEIHTSDGEPTRVTALDMNGVSALGLVKMDVLGLANLTVLERTQQAIYKRTGKLIDFEALTFDDQPTIDAFTRQEFTGIFQFDASSARSVCEGLTFEGFADVAALTALNRPGLTRSGLTDKFRARRQDPSKIEAVHEDYDAITADTLGIIVYQEQLIRLFRQLAGFTPEEADKMRKIVGKKLGEDEMNKHRAQFLSGAAVRGMTEEVADGIFDSVLKFAAYAFNMCVDISTEVWTTGGVKRADSLQIGDKIAEVANGQLRIGRVRRVWPVEVRDRIRLVFDDGSEVVCTPEHRWLTDAGVRNAVEIIKEARPVAQARGLDESLRAVVPDAEAEEQALSDVRSLPSLAPQDSGGNDGASEPRALGEDRKVAIGDGASDFVARGRSAGPGGSSSPVARGEFGEVQGSMRGTDGRIKRFGSGSIDSVEPGRSDLVDLAARSVPEECAGSSTQYSAAGGLRRTVHGGSRRTASLSADLRGGEVHDNESSRSDLDALGVSETSDTDPDLDRRLHIRREPPTALVEDSTWDLGARNDEAGAFGRDFAYRRLVFWERLAAGSVVDIEVGGDHLFALGNGLISHNSHACSYAAIAYWEQWAKVHYPEEFLWALMASAKDSDEALSYIPEARRLGIQILPPDINESGARWTLTGPKTIRAGLGDIKSIGQTAIAAIVAAQPFPDLVDFLTRVGGRAVNRKIVDHLIRSGAMRPLLPNTKWALEEFGVWFDARGKKGWEVEVAAGVATSRKLPDYSDEDQLALALAVSPHGAGRHPLDLFAAFFEVGGLLAARNWIPLSYIWDYPTAYVYGIVTSVKFRTVGDFGGESLSEADKKKKQFGRRFAVIELQDKAGNGQRIKVDPDALERFGHVVDRGPGNCVAIQVATLAKFKSVRGVVLADLDDIRQKGKVGAPLSLWERTFTSDHPVLAYSRKSFARRAGGKYTATALITHVRETIDKNGNDMAFFGLQDGYGQGVECVSFASTWDAHRDAVIVGSVVDLELKVDSRSVVLDENGITDTRSRAPAHR